MPRHHTVAVNRPRAAHHLRPWRAHRSRAAAVRRRGGPPRDGARGPARAGVRAGPAGSPGDGGRPRRPSRWPRGVGRRRRPTCASSSTRATWATSASPPAGRSSSCCRPAALGEVDDVEPGVPPGAPRAEARCSPSCWPSPIRFTAALEGRRGGAPPGLRDAPARTVSGYFTALQRAQLRRRRAARTGPRRGDGACPRWPSALASSGLGVSRGGCPRRVG